MVTTRTTTRVGLRVVLAGWLENNTCWKGYFPGFRRAGGELRKATRDYDYWDPVSTLEVDGWRNAS